MIQQLAAAKPPRKKRRPNADSDITLTGSGSVSLAINITFGKYNIIFVLSLSAINRRITDRLTDSKFPKDKEINLNVNYNNFPFFVLVKQSLGNQHDFQIMIFLRLSALSNFKDI